VGGRLEDQITGSITATMRAPREQTAGSARWKAPKKKAGWSADWEAHSQGGDTANSKKEIFAQSGSKASPMASRRLGQQARRGTQWVRTYKEKVKGHQVKGDRGMVIRGALAHCRNRYPPRSQYSLTNKENPVQRVALAKHELLRLTSVCPKKKKELPAASPNNRISEKNEDTTSACVPLNLSREEKTARTLKKSGRRRWRAGSPQKNLDNRHITRHYRAGGLGPQRAVSTATGADTLSTANRETR